MLSDRLLAEYDYDYSCEHDGACAYDPGLRFTRVPLVVLEDLGFSWQDADLKGLVGFRTGSGAKVHVAGCQPDSPTFPVVVPWCETGQRWCVTCGPDVGRMLYGLLDAAEQVVALWDAVTRMYRRPRGPRPPLDLVFASPLPPGPQDPSLGRAALSAITSLEEFEFLRYQGQEMTQVIPRWAGLVSAGVGLKNHRVTGATALDEPYLGWRAFTAATQLP